MMQQNRISRGAVLLGLSLLGSALVWLFLSGVRTVQATPPIEGNPISMGSASTVATTSNPARAVAAADLDQNGRPGPTFGQRGFLQGAENTCDTVFDDTGVVVGPLDPARGMVIGDLDRDGRPDIVTDQSGHMRAWENDGTPFEGTWPQHELGWSENIVPRALADLDGDEDLDIVATNWCCAPNWRIEIWRNGGDPFGGQWTTHPTIGSLPAFVSAMAVGDLDGNGTPEIVAGIGGNGSIPPTIEIWRFEGDPFATSWISAEVAVVSYTVHSIALGDLDNNGRLDIIFGTNHAPSADPMLEVYQLRAARNDGAPFDGGWTLFDFGRDPQWTGLEPAHGYRGETILSVSLADFDNDSYLDIATGEDINGDHQIMVWKNSGTPFDGQLWQPTAVGLGPGGAWLEDTARSVMPEDFNGDGLVDLVTGSDPAEPYELIWWENNGIPFGAVVTDTHWIRHDVGATERHMCSVDVADFDSDGDMDFASQVCPSWPGEGNAVHIWQNKTAGCMANVNVEANPSTIPANGTSTSLVTATVQDAYGNPVMNGTVVTFTTTLGNFPTAPYTTTTLNGVATATLTSSTTAGTAVVTATAGTTSGQTTVNFTSFAASVNVEANPSKIPADGISTSLVTATVEDAHGHPVENGTAVTFATTLGSFSTAPYTTTTFSGVATATLTSSTTAGTAVVTATAGTTSGQTTVTFETGSNPTTTFKVFLPVVMRESGN